MRGRCGRFVSWSQRARAWPRREIRRQRCPSTIARPSCLISYSQSEWSKGCDIATSGIGPRNGTAGQLTVHPGSGLRCQTLLTCARLNLQSHHESTLMRSLPVHPIAACLDKEAGLFADILDWLLPELDGTP